MTTPRTDAVHSLPAGTWRLDPARTTVTVTANKLGLFTVPATLTVSSGTIQIDADHQVTGAEVVVDAASYTSKNAKRNEHVRGADFLDADNHPDLVFRSRQITANAGDYQVNGSVTVKARTYPLSVEVTDVAVDARQASFGARAVIDRKAIGVGKLPSFIVGRDLQLAVTAHAVVAEA